jgi:hypothetical protein
VFAELPKRLLRLRRRLQERMLPSKGGEPCSDASAAFVLIEPPFQQRILRAARKGGLSSFIYYDRIPKHVGSNLVSPGCRPIRFDRDSHSSLHDRSVDVQMGSFLEFGDACSEHNTASHSDKLACPVVSGRDVLPTFLPVANGPRARMPVRPLFGENDVFEGMLWMRAVQPAHQRRSSVSEVPFVDLEWPLHP